MRLSIGYIKWSDAEGGYLPQCIIQQLPIWASCLVEVEGLQRSSKSYLSLCLAEGMLELSLLWVTGGLCYQGEVVSLSPRSMPQIKCTCELCCAQNWWLRFGLLRSGCAVFISLKQGHLYAMRDRATAHRTKTASELWRKYIVISLCKGTIKFCIEFKAKRTRGRNNMLWMLFHHSASLIVSCFTLCLLLEMLLAVNELSLKGFYHHIPFKCLGLELLS